MGYPDPLKLVNRQIGKHILVSSCPFGIANRLDVGGRMLAFNYEADKLILYSALPYGDEVVKAWQQLTGASQTNFDVTHIVVANNEHNMVAQSYKQQFPNVKIIAAENIKRVHPDVKLTSQMGGQILDKDGLVQAGVTEPLFVDNIQLAYLSRHKTKEVILYEKNEKVLCVGDSIFNLSAASKQEQYSEALGFAGNHTPFTGWSFALRYINPGSAVGRWMMRRVSGANTPEGKADFQRIVDTWPFERIEVQHGEPITADAKKVFAEALGLKN